MIKTGSVDTNKGGERSIEIRRRLVAKEVKETQQHRGGERELLRIHSTS